MLPESRCLGWSTQGNTDIEGPSGCGHQCAGQAGDRSDGGRPRAYPARHQPHNARNGMSRTSRSHVFGAPSGAPRCLYMGKLIK